MIPVPIDIETGLPKWTAEEWARLSEADRRIATRHNSAARQQMARMYEAMRERDDDG